MSAHRDAGEAAVAAAVAAGRLPRLEGKMRWLLPLTTTKDFFKDCKVCDTHTGEAMIAGCWTWQQGHVGAWSRGGGAL
jgi:hypothetical protein